MDPVRFDTLAKALPVSGTRRGIIRLLAALPLGVALTTHLGAEEAGAEKPLDRVRRRAHNRQQRRQGRDPGQHKDNPTGKRKGKRDRKPAPLPFGAVCTSNAACASGICACRANDCSGDGFCAADGSGGTYSAGDVATPSGTAIACTIDGGGLCSSGACADPNQVCTVTNFCAILIPD